MKVVDVDRVIRVSWTTTFHELWRRFIYRSNMLCQFRHIPTADGAPQTHIEAALTHGVISFGHSSFTCQDGQLVIVFDKKSRQMALLSITGEKSRLCARTVWPAWSKADNANVWNVEFISTICSIPANMELRLTRQGILQIQDRDQLVACLARQWLLNRNAE